MRMIVVAVLALAACGPNRVQQQGQEIIDRHMARADRVRDNLPLYREMCRAQMPSVSDAAVDLCARERGIAEVREIGRQGQAELDTLRGTLRRPDPAPIGSGWNPMFVTPVR